jgi:hypothetical protein
LTLKTCLKKVARTSGVSSIFTKYKFSYNCGDDGVIGVGYGSGGGGGDGGGSRVLLVVMVIMLVILGTVCFVL